MHSGANTVKHTVRFFVFSQQPVLNSENGFAPHVQDIDGKFLSRLPLLLFHHEVLYIKIGWKTRQAAFAEKHKDELTSYNKAYRTLKKHGVDLNVNLGALQTEYDGLKATHAELSRQLAGVKAELQPMKDIRYWISKVIAPEQDNAEKKPEPKHSPAEQIRFYQEQEKQKSPQHKNHDLDR